MLIKACLNGARPLGAHPSLPVTPDELANAALDAARAGAGAVHVHPRAKDGSESLSAVDIGGAVRGVRDACPGLPVGVSTGAWIVRDPTQRLRMVAAWRDLPDFASVNWREEGAEDLVEQLLGMGIGVEAGLFNLDDARAFAESRHAARCLRALIEVGGRDGVDPVREAAEMDSLLSSHLPALPLLHHGFGADTWRVIDAALRAGRDVRVGLEDTLTLPDGSPAADNAELVSAAVEIARRHGHTPVSIG